jgi:hypothetical protein
MQPEHPFPGMPVPIPSKGIKPTTYPTSKPFNPNAIAGGTPSSPTDPPSSDSSTALVGSPYSVPQKKWIVVDADGSETWFSGHDGAWGWFMASPFAVRIYLLTNGVRSLIGGIPYHSKPWHPNSLPIPFVPKLGVNHSKVACCTIDGLCLGTCNFEHGNTKEDKLFFTLRGFWDREGWRFYPNPAHPYVGKHTRGQKFHATYKESIPAWATPLITKWVLCE